MKILSLKSKITRLVTGALCITALFGIFSILIYYKFQALASIRTIQEKLLATLSQQANTLVIGYLLPEQKEGFPLQLEKFRGDEKLASVEIITTPRLINNFNDCKFNNHSSTCLSSDGKFIGVLAPIREDEKIYGYLFKTKEIDQEILDYNLLPVSILIISCFLLASILLMVPLARLTSRVIPNTLQELAQWVKKALEVSTPQYLYQKRLLKNSISLQVRFLK